MSEPRITKDPRRHDLDALRAFAMLAGIALHGALAFMPAPWPVQDERQSDVFGLAFAAIHGFRMPLFFLMSGFFTAMLWRRRGLGAMLGQRMRRVFLPLLLGLVTIVPATNWVIDRAIEAGAWRRTAAPVVGGDEVNRPDPDSGLTPLSLAVIADRTEMIERLLEGGARANARNRDGSSPLAVAALLGRTEAAGRLIEAGAQVDARAADASTPLHTAAFFGRAETVALLVDKGADTGAKNGYGQTPIQVTATDWGTTKYVADLVRLEVDREEVEAGRARAVEILGRGRVEVEAPTAPSPIRAFLEKPLFHHLWFLWFLSLMVAGFAAYAHLADRRGWKGLPVALISSPLRFLWLIPLTIVPELLSDPGASTFGPDTSTSLLPLPHVLAQYALFFGFGALYFDGRDDSGRVGRWWWISLPLGLLVIFPLGLAFVSGDGIEASSLHRPISLALEAAYAWVMTFGLMGLFRHLLTRENRTVRYISDASYWLYLAHVPLIIGAQMLVKEWPLPAVVKFTLVCATVTGLLLVVYQIVVRDRWLGRFLNGPRRSRIVTRARAASGERSSEGDPAPAPGLRARP